MQIFQSMYSNVKLDDERYGNIIQFYNDIYIHPMKEYAMNINNKNSKDIKVVRPRIPALGPQSPLKQSLPPLRMTYQTIYTNRGAGTPSRFGMNTPGFRNYPGLAMTPRTKTLYVFGESATNELDRANTEIKKTFNNSKKAHKNLKFGAVNSKLSSQGLKSQLIRSMKQGPKSAGITTVAGKPPVGPPPVVIKGKNNKMKFKESISSEVIKEDVKKEEEED